MEVEVGGRLKIDLVEHVNWSRGAMLLEDAGLKPHRYERWVGVIFFALVKFYFNGQLK